MRPSRIVQIPAARSSIGMPLSRPRPRMRLITSVLFALLDELFGLEDDVVPRLVEVVAVLAEAVIAPI